MKNLRVLVLIVVVVFAGVLAGFAWRQDGQVTRPQLRKMLEELGYEVTDLNKDEGKEKYSVTFTKYDLNIPVGFEISPSNTYIWLTINLGPAPTEGNAKCLSLLKQNSKVQPTFFYVTDAGRLMAALAIENRGLTNQVLRSRAESVSDNVGKTKEFWQGE